MQRAWWKNVLVGVGVGERRVERGCGWWIVVGKRCGLICEGRKVPKSRRSHTWGCLACGLCQVVKASKW